MKIRITNFHLAGLLFACLLMLMSNVQAQISFTGSSLTYSQNFDGISGATLPTGITQNGSGSAGTTATALNGTSSGNSYVFISGSDKAVGFLNSGSYTTGKYIVAQFTNNTGSLITALAVSFDYEKYRTGNRAWTFNFATSTNGSSYTNNASGTHTWNSDGANGSGIFPPQSVSKSFSITGLSIPNGTSYYMRWQLDGNGGSTNGQALAIDNIVVVATAGAIKPDIINPTATNIADISARLGATVVTAGDSAITSRGIVWSTSTNPEIGGPGVTRVNVPGTTGVFDTLVTGLPSATQIFYRGFATSGAGTVYTATASFYTLATSPQHVTNLRATAVSNHDIGLKWTPSPDANGYLVIQKLYTAPNAFPQDRMRYKEGDMIGDGEVVDTILNVNADTAFYSALISGTVYQYALVPFRFNAISVETYNYNTDVVPVAFDTTWGVGPSALSDIVGIPQSEAQSISSIVTGPLTATNTGVKVWQLSLRDGGAALNDPDAMPTTVTRMVLIKGAGNKVANWSNILAYAALYNDSTGAKFADAAIYKDSLVFSGMSWVAEDNNEKTLTLRVSLKTTGIIDRDSFLFAVKKANIITPSLNISSQIPVLDLKSDSLKNIVEVQASKIVITQQPPASAGINTILPAVKALLVDSNGNTDLDNAAAYSLTCIIPMQYVQTKNASSGELVFDSVSLSSLAKGIRLKIAGGGLDTAYTNPVSIFASSQSIIKATSGFIYTDSILYASYQSAAISATNAVDVFGLTVVDGGALANDGDNFGTTLSSLRLNVGGSAYIRSLALYHGSVKLGEQAVSSSNVLFNNFTVTANDNDSTFLTISATFNSRYANGQRISFTVTGAVSDTASGSVFALANAGGATSVVTGAANVLKYESVFVTPPFPSVVKICAGSNVVLTSVKPAGTILNWYTAESSFLPVHTGDSLILDAVDESVTYFIASDSSGWLSNKVKAEVIAAKISSPGLIPSSVCKGSNASVQVSSAYGVKWYRNFSDINPVHTGNTFNIGIVNNDTIFYVQADSSGCLSKKVPAAVTVIRVPAPVIKDTTVCKAQPVTLMASGNHPVKWFGTASSSVAIANGFILVTAALQKDTTFYIESDSSGCSSLRKPVNVAVRSVPVPVLASDSASICSGASALFITGNGTSVNWYATSTAINPLSVNDSFETPALIAAAVYYTAAFANGCVSERKQVTVKVNAFPAAPVIKGDSVCAGETLTLSATSNAAKINWYDAETGGNAVSAESLFVTPPVHVSTVYYAEAVSNGCSTARVSAPVTVKVKPAAPVVSANVISCTGKQLKLGAFATSGIVKWFASLTDTASIGADSLLTVPLLADVKYYAATQLNGCMSSKATVTVKVNGTPDAAFTINETEQCLENNQFVFINTTNNPQATQYAWLFGDSSSFGFMNPVKTYNAKGSYAVKLRATNNGCVSEQTRQVTVKAPDVDFTYTVNTNTVNFTPVAAGISTYKWHFTTSDSSSVQQAQHTFAANGTYAVTLTVTDASGCSSSVTKNIVITKTGLTDVFNSTYKLEVYPNPFKDQVQVNYITTERSEVKINMYDVTGRLVKEVFDAEQAAGSQQVQLNLGEYRSGVYLLKIQISNQVKTIRLIAE